MKIDVFRDFFFLEGAEAMEEDAEGSRHEHGRAEHALRGAKASRRWCDAKTCEGSFRETNVER